MAKEIGENMAGELDGVAFLENICDLRTKPLKRTIIFCPVGDEAQLVEFCRHVRSLGIEKDFDFLLIYRKGVPYDAAKGLSALHATEKYPLGTAGGFFAGQICSYLLNYETIVNNDLDAYLDCKESLFAMVEKARSERTSVIPYSKSAEEKTIDKEYIVINSWHVYHREVFERAGFYFPYTWKGGEDYEYAQRLKLHNKLVIYENAVATHPKEGLSIFHKMHSKRKYYPYVGGLLKAYLFCTAYSKKYYFLYVLWYVYYSFFCDLFSDNELRNVLGTTNSRRLAMDFSSQQQLPFSISRKPNSVPQLLPIYRRFTHTIASLARLVLFGKCTIMGEDVRLSISRPRFLAMAIFGLLLFPLRLLDAILKAASWKRDLGTLPFPITTQNYNLAIQEYISLLSQAKT